MAIKKMQINIEINTECDSPNKVKDLILAMMNEAGDRNFPIHSVTIDGVENFRMETGFMNDLAKKTEEMDSNSEVLNPYEKYLHKFAENHRMTIEEAKEQPMVKARLHYFQEMGQ